MISMKIMFFTRLFIGLLISLWSFSSFSQVSQILEENFPYEISIKGGGIIGDLIYTVPPKEGSEGKSSDETYTIGGFILAMDVQKGLSMDYTFHVQPQLAVEISELQIVRKGIDAGIAYHLYGGARRVKKEYKYINFAGTTPFNFSLLARAGYHAYSYSSASDSSEVLTGAALEGKAGIEYRKDYFKDSSLGVELVATLFSVPAGVERVKFQGIELTLFWRI